MSIRRYRRNELLTRAAVSSPTLSVSNPALEATQFLTMRRVSSFPDFRIEKAGSLRSGGSSPSSLSSAATLVDRSVASTSKSIAGCGSPFTQIPTELQLAVLEFLPHNDLLAVRRTSRSCARLAEHRLRKTTAVRLSVNRERLDAASSTLETLEHTELPLMLFNHQNLAVLEPRDIDELRRYKNPTAEIRMITQAMVALHRGHFASNPRDEAAVGQASWAATRAELGSRSFRQWIARLRASAESMGPAGRVPLPEGSLAAAQVQALPESALLSSGQLRATEIWRTTETTFGRMAGVSTVGRRALTFVSAAVHYIGYRTSIVHARAKASDAQGDVARLEKYAAALRSRS